MNKKSTSRKDWREERRMRALELRKQGWKQRERAEALGVSEGAVSQWMKKAREQGVEALRCHPSPGGIPKLTAEQRAHIPALLDKGAEAFGFRGQVWTTARGAQMSEKEFGVHSHRAHCSRLLRQLKYSLQKPIEKPTQRDEAAIERWKKQRFEELKSKANVERQTIACVDESSLYLLPMAVRTYAPVGQTPVLRVTLTSDHLSAIGGITPEGRLILRRQDHSYKGPDVVRFFQLLLREIPGKILVVWDGSTIHRCQVVKAFVATPSGKRIQLEQLPGYAPELNPMEGVWNLLKRAELKNVCCLDLPHVQLELRRAKERLRHRTSVLRQCFAHAGYSLSFSRLRSIDVPNSSTANGTQIELWDDNGGANQHWRLIMVDVKIVNAGTGKVLEIPSGSVTVEGARADQSDDTGGTNQRWQFVPVGTAVFNIVNVASGGILDVTGEQAVNGALVLQWANLGTATQRWEIGNAGNGLVTLMNAGGRGGACMYEARAQLMEL